MLTVINKDYPGVPVWGMLVTLLTSFLIKNSDVISKGNLSPLIFSPS